MKKKITPTLIAEARELAKDGFSHLQIAKSIGISSSTLYADSDMMDTIRGAEDELRREIANDIRNSSNNGEVSAQIFLSKRLNLHHTSYKMPKVISVSGAMSQISRINSDMAAGLLPLELGNTLIKNLETYLKAFEVNELEQRIISLEESQK